MFEVPRERQAKMYRKGGKRYPSVTEILGRMHKEYYSKWRRKIGESQADAIMDNAAAFGVSVHKVAEMVARDKTRYVLPHMEPFAEAIQAFFDEHVEKVLGTEMELISEEYIFGGTCDLWCLLKDGRHAVVDWKTTRQLTREHGLQVAAYGLLLKENGYRINHRMVVRIKKEKPGGLYVRHYEEHENDSRAFLGACALWHWNDNGKLVGDEEAMDVGA